MQRRIADGGLGLRRRGGPHAAASWLASWAQCYSAVVASTSWTVLPSLEAAPSGTVSASIHQAAQQVIAHGARGAQCFLDANAWRALSHMPAKGLQRSLRRSLEQAARHRWWCSASTEVAAMAASCSGWGAGAALLRPPTERALQLSDADLRIAVCERLSVDLADDSSCMHVSRAGRVCSLSLRRGAHAHCCSGTSGVRTARRHNPLVREFAQILSAAGRRVAVEQRDPSMGPNARLDIVEFASDSGGPAAYDVSVVTPLRADASFREACASEPGLACELRHAHKLDTQYGGRQPGALLHPLVAEVGGRWHPSVPRLVRRLAREYAARSHNRDLENVSAATAARWGARLSALLLGGNAAVHRAAQTARSDASTELQATHTAQMAPARAWVNGTSSLPHLVPEGDSSYELLCLACGDRCE